MRDECLANGFTELVKAPGPEFLRMWVVFEPILYHGSLQSKFNA